MSGMTCVWGRVTPRRRHETCTSPIQEETLGTAFVGSGVSPPSLPRWGLGAEAPRAPIERG